MIPFSFFFLLLLSGDLDDLDIDKVMKVRTNDYPINFVILNRKMLKERNQNLLCDSQCGDRFVK